eukprot:m.127805 g.127805  ORF g.127805 m.127805 type:complete len:439 (+) comp11217_c0_seq3:404-1720(+)
MLRMESNHVMVSTLLVLVGFVMGRGWDFVYNDTAAAMGPSSRSTVASMVPRRDDNDASLPLVSIMTMSKGQYWCNRNSILNACYQRYPHARLELLVAETSLSPSAFYLGANATRSWGCIDTRVWWYNASEPSGDLNPPLGKLRDMLMHDANGDILIFMDNDDFYHPNYVEGVVDAFAPFRIMTPAESSSMPLPRASNTRRPSLDTTVGSPSPPPARMHRAAIVMMERHMDAVLNPDGTLFVRRGRKGLVWGSHMTSFSRAIFDVCGPVLHVPRALNEEKNVHTKCVKEHDVPVVRVPTLNDGVRAADNAMLLVKFKSGLSVTHQLWKNDRAWLSRLTTRDWADVVAMQVAHYETFHELSRPTHISRLPYNSTASMEPSQWNGPPRVFRIPSVYGATHMNDTNPWESFWRRNTDFFDKHRNGSNPEDVLRELLDNARHM